MEPIAIVGSACRFPGAASSPSKLWDLLREPRDVLREFDPETRLNLDKFYNTNGEHHGQTNVQNKSYLLEEDHRLFDAAFFRINPREAHGMDPQQRLLLETVFESFEAAGKPMDAVEESSTSVYVGVMTSDFHDIQMRDPETLPKYTATGVARSILSNRISYFFNLRGPSMTIDTACSSSLVALHLAVQSLRNGEAAQAIVAGSTLLMDTTMYIAESKLQMLSPDSRSRMWDKDANGYARGEGCASLLLKPLSKAIADGDHIECVIRETAVNSDGRTNGITMPSSPAQTSLIRQCYTNANLNIDTERCQYFECHGTGTLAGDPVEARAIHDAFFPPGASKATDDASRLYCGSIKTVVGHLEGCAGLAGILKASLAIQNSAIPPNMHFNELNPAITPYYNNLRVPTKVVPWPDTNGGPRRASVNSFGFGGTNAHAILESYEPSSPQQQPSKSIKQSIPASPSAILPGPFIFSAKSRSSLLKLLKNTQAHLLSKPDFDLDALSATLQSKRSTFAVRLVIGSRSREQLLEALTKHIEQADKSLETLRLAPTPQHPDEPRGLLGVFTGQGAQWASMGAQLIHSSPLFRASIDACQTALKTLPDPPTWSLVDELLADASTSRIGQAEFSQPLCTALQIALVDLLTATGITFDAVIGHSSGEIGAAYAAGYLSLRDAVAIAYYRGFVAHMAQGANGQKGGMLAVGLSYEEALAFCTEQPWSGRLGVAASNSPTSVTLSGDREAIEEAKAHFEAQKTFARALQVDTAYHSHHMQACSAAYLGKLREVGVQLQKPREGCVWSSSVRGDTEQLLPGALDALKGQYWVDNMVQPVLFSQALECALWHGGPFDLALEVGPHPALKGPAGQTLKAVLGAAFPYMGCLERKADDVVAVSSAVGFVWSQVGAAYVDFPGFRKAFGLEGAVQVLKDLPPYPFDHDQVYWQESRVSQNYRLGRQKGHELLGQVLDSCGYEMTWRNIFRLNELPWIRGHQFQGQAIFPGAGYVSMALEAAQVLVQRRPMKLVEVLDTNIIKGLVLEEDSAGVETIFSIHSDVHPNTVSDNGTLEASFACYMSLNNNAMEKCSDGRIVIHLGESEAGLLPALPSSDLQLPPMDVDRFYQAISGLGIVYDEAFRTLTSIDRTWGRASASASWEKGSLGNKFMLHPAVLDVGFQAGLAAWASIAENAMGATRLPASIRRVAIDPSQTFRTSNGDTQTLMRTFVTRADANTLEVDVNLYDADSHAPGVQVDGLVLKAISELKASDDRQLFAKTVWDRDVLDGWPDLQVPTKTQADLQYIDAVERTTLYFFQNLLRTIKEDEVSSLKWYHQEFLKAIREFLRPVQQGKHAVLKKDWLNDSRELIDDFAKRYPDSVDIGLLRAVGDNMASVMRGESEMLEHMLKDNLLSRLYMEGRGFAKCNEYVADLMRYVSHKFPRTNILEIGAGTGGTTRSIFDAIGHAYQSYTYTDISAGFFEKANEKFSDHAHKMTFKVFNAEKTAEEQGFEEGSYDVIIAANVLHATRDLAETMLHARSLLRPGGYLLAVEVTGTMLREPGLMGGLEGWWLGVDDGRFPSPGIQPNGWDQVLRKTGFSGVDHIIYDFPDIARHNCSVFVSQAVDQKFDLLREPMTAVDRVPTQKAVIIGGTTLPVARVVRTAEKALKRWTSDVLVYNDIDSIDLNEIDAGTCVLCLTELDRPIFSEPMKESTLETLQDLLGNVQNVLWVTSGRQADDPYSNMMVGIGRTLYFELPQLTMQFLDFAQKSSWDMDLAVKQLLQMNLLSSTDYRDYQALWVHEQEIVVDDGRALIPRVVQDHEVNEGLNAKRRRIVKSADPARPVSVQYGETTTALVQHDSQPVPNGHVQLATRFSVATHWAGSAPSFLVLGQLVDSKEWAVTVHDAESSIVTVPRSEIFTLPSGTQPTASLLLTIGSSLLASQTISTSPSKGTILVYQPDEVLAAAFRAASAALNRRVLFINSTASPQQDKAWVTIHPFAQPRSVASLLPKDSCLLVSQGNSNAWTMAPHLPKTCSTQVLSFTSPVREAGAEIAKAYQYAKAFSGKSFNVNTVAISEVPRDAQPQKPLSVIHDWEHSEPFEVTVLPPDLAAVLSADKTYFMVGMASELGQTTCRYMISCGARNIVLASRNPNIDPSWLEEMSELGANIKVVKLDVTDKDQLHAVVEKIRQNMPPIGGVFNGALVLEDVLFVNSTVTNLAKQFAAKVDGTRLLDEEFASEKLDFFVAFSSLGSVYGNAGQSIYHAANLYMTSLVEQRRRRGQAGSVINIGLLVDVGYVARSDRDGARIEQHLRSQFYTPLSETEYHHLVLQGILSSPPTSSNADITMGIEPFIDSPTAETKPHWYRNPRFSHMILSPPSGSDGQAASGTSSQQLQAKLKEASSVTEATEIFQELFCLKIESMMNMPAASINVGAPLSELGLDSLLAVEIRTWLLKELHVDVPVLKILGQEPMSAICAAAAARFMQGKPQTAAPAEEKAEEKEALEAIEEPAKPVDAAPKAKLVKDDAERSLLATPDRSTTPVSTSDALSVAGSKTEGGITPGGSTPTTAASEDESTSSADPLESLGETLLAKEHERVERMSYAQARLHFLQGFLEDPTSFNVTVRYDIQGRLNVSRFVRALEKALAHHEAFQTCFFAEPGNLSLQQGIAKRKSLPFSHLAQVTPKEVDQAFRRLADHVWNLETGNTFHAVLASQAADKHSIIFGYHHIIMDGTSWHVFLQDLDQAYRMAPLTSVGSTYSAFAKEQSQRAQAGELEESLGYWSELLTPTPNVIPLLPFALTRTRKPLRTYSNHHVKRELSVDTVKKIKEASQACRATPFHFHLTILQPLFAQFTDIDDICVGVADAGRPASGFDRTVGFFVNLLPLRFNIDRGESFATAVSKTSQTILEGQSNGLVPIDLILERMGIRRSTHHSPLFQITFNYRAGDLLQVPLGSCEMKLHQYEDAKTPYDMTFNVTQTSSGGHLVELTTSASLYSEAASEMILDTYVQLLSAFSAKPSTTLQDYKANEDSAQTDRVLQLGRGPRVEYPWPETLVARFQEVLKEQPSATAIKDDTQSLTYAQLAERVNAIGASLSKGTKAIKKVAVLANPSADTYAAMLAILSIGADYVPLDMSLPHERHAVMIDVCKPDALLYHSATAQPAAAFESQGLATISLDNIPASSKKPLPTSKTPGGFLMFTSGSTGTPKGISLTQAGIMNYAAAKSAKLKLGRVVALQQSSTGFDMSIAQAYNAFCNGGTLVVAPLAARGDPTAIARLMRDTQVEFTICTPSEYLMLLTYGGDELRQCKAFKYACSGGEAVTEKLTAGLRRLDLPALTLLDCYGPTEISCAATFRKVAIDGAAASDGNGVGTTIANTSIYILNDQNQPCRVGMPGEIHVGGRGVARGYLDAQMSASKFLNDPFATAEDVSRGWTKMYKTGDVGCIADDGSLIYMGRAEGDTTIKLRGLRIDLDEVANAVHQAAEGKIADAVVTVRGQPEFLVAHVVFAQGQHMSSDEVSDLRSSLPLPRYMIPAMIVVVERLPTSPNGKVDRKAVAKLDLPEQAAESADDEARLTIPEGELRLLWRDVLGDAVTTSKIQANTDFFTVGGSSLLLVQLQNAIKERIGVMLPLQDLYQSSTLAKMAARVSHDRSELTEEQIDWAAETAVPQEIRDVAKASIKSAKAPQKTQRRVLLTGAAGFLGGEILAALLQDSSVAHVHCVAIATDAEHKLPSSDKITLHNGSLLSPTLGLTSSEIDFLRANADQIIHAGSQGHCLNNYTSVKPSNVTSTHFLASLALPRRIPFHFISSGRAILQSGSTTFPQQSLASHPPPTDGSQGYTSSKWASEVFLEKLAETTNLPVVLHRACSLIGPHAPHDDALNSLIRYSIESARVPILPNAEGFIDFQDVGRVAAAIAKAGSSSITSKKESTPVFVHHSSNVRVTVADLGERMSVLNGGKKFTPVPMDEWIAIASKLGIEELIVSYLEANVANGARLTFPYLGA